MKFMLNVMEDVKRGDMVHMINWKLHVVKSGLTPPLGVAARDIKKGDRVDYDSTTNTKDILINTFGSTS